MSASAPPPRATQALGSTRVLIVGRTTTEAESLEKRVQREGYLAETVGDEAEAFKILRSEPFDLVLLDLDAPGIDGPEFVGALRKDAELASTPVIVLSAIDDLDAIERCLERRADEYLPKAFGPAVLRARVNAALDRRRLRDAQGLRREMAVARNIQRDFLPERLPVTRGVQIDASLQPARQVSGDFYDAFQIESSGNIVLVVGDVCDKGFGAALFMALFRSLIRASADPVGGGAIAMIGGRRTIVKQQLESATPADLLTRVAGFTNNYIARLHGRTNMFATVFLASLNPDYGELVYVNAGHEPALIIAPDGTVKELRPTGPALGLMPDSEFTAVEGTLEPGHSLFAFTDGLVEARSPTGDVFGSDRLREVVRANAGASATELVRGVSDALRGFVQQAEPHDDLTLLAASRAGR
jgi:sigma-B regulation protein RsbU (phosphoserine phosphatase)